MFKNGYYYPDWIWKNKIHKNEETGEFEGSAAFNFITGNREAGKSVGVGLYAIDDFVKYGYKTVIIRRYLKEFQQSKTSTSAFWEKARPWSEHTDLQFYYKNSQAYINGELFCYPVALNDVNNVKNEAFDGVRTIIFDEFQAENGKEVRFGGMNEFECMLSIYSTIARGRENAKKDTSIVFISNSVTKNNIYFRELGITKELRPETKKILRPEMGYCLENVQNEAVKAAVEDSAIGKILMNTKSGQSYYGYAYENSFKDNLDYIDPNIPGKQEYLCTVAFRGELFSFRFIRESGCWYFTDVVDKTYPKFIALTKEDQTINTVLLNLAYKASFKVFKQAYEQGALFFPNLKCKKVFEEVYSVL